MAKKTIERSYPGKSADALYLEVEKVIGELGRKYGIACRCDPAGRRIEVAETMGVRGHCVVAEGHVRIDLEHGLIGTPLAGRVKSYIEDKLSKLFA
jgi:hypothetical protein